MSKSAPRKKYNSEDLIVEWLSMIPHQSVIGSTYGIFFNPDTLMRKFRGIKNEKQYMLKDAGVILKRVKTQGKEKSWEVLNAS